MIVGNSLKVYFGVEDPSVQFGTVPAEATHRIKVANESLQAKYNKKDEGLLTGGIATGRVSTMSRKVEGALSTLLRPDDSSLLFYLLLGVETTQAASGAGGDSLTHTYGPIGTELTDSLPSCTIGFDRTIEKDLFTGCKVVSMSFSAQQEDYVKVDMNLVGSRRLVQEMTGAKALKPSPQAAFKFLGGEFKIKGEHVADVTNIKFDYNNNLDANIMTCDSGEFFIEPECGARDLKLDIDVLYSQASLKLKEQYYDTDDDFAVSLHFSSAEKAKDGENFKVDIEIPAVQVIELSSSVGGPEKVIQKMSMKAIENFTDPLITVSVHNNVTETYNA